MWKKQRGRQGIEDFDGKKQSTEKELTIIHVHAERKSIYWLYDLIIVHTQCLKVNLPVILIR